MLHSSDGFSQRMTSLGKRRKRSAERKKRQSEQEDEVVVVQTIHITDKFGFDRESRKVENMDEETRNFVEPGKNNQFETPR